MTPDWESEDGAVRLYCGDCLKVLPELSGVDAVVTDPPYPREFVPIYEKLAEAAASILPDGGLLLTLSGHHSLDIIIGGMAKHLRFYWMGGMPNKRGSIARYHPRQMMMGWKPCLWFAKGSVDKHPYVFDFMESNRIDRVNHKWEQSVGWFEYYIEKLFKPEQTILDPFMGAGTTGIACVKAGRRFVGIEIDAEHFETSKHRIQQALIEKSELLIA
jgi:16S rRNA G966 N2-methylase RsmD